MKRDLFTCENRLRVSVSRSVEWHDRWLFHVQGGYDSTILRVDMTRDEALKLRASLNTMLKATAPPRKRRAR